MELYQYLLLVVIIAFAFPAGSFIAKLTKEELKAGKRWFQLLIVLAIAVIISSLCILKNCGEDFLLIASSMLFIIIIASVSIAKEKKRKRR